MRRTRLTLMLLTALALPASALADTRPAPELRAVHAVLELQPALVAHASVLSQAGELAATPEEVSEAVAAGTPQLGELLQAPAALEEPGPVPGGTLDPDVVGPAPALELTLTGVATGNLALAIIGGIMLAVWLARRYVPALSSGLAAVGVALVLGVLSELAVGVAAGAPLTLALVLAGLIKGALAMAGFDTAKAATKAGAKAAGTIRTRLDVARVLGGGPRA